MNAIAKKQPPTKAGGSTPRLSVKTAALLLAKPIAETARALRKQKFPTVAPQKFMVPFYQLGFTGIRHLIDHGAAGLIEARALQQQIPNAVKRKNNLRFLDGYASSALMDRPFVPAKGKHAYYAMVGEVELRLSPDIVAYEDDEIRFLYFNATANPFDAEAARRTLEIAYWLLQQNGVDIKPHQLEFIDLFHGDQPMLLKGKPPRKTTLKLLEETAALIETIWETLEP